MHWTHPVQIPLWSMNTSIQEVKADPDKGSDSSMVDEYHPHRKAYMNSIRFRFLYGRWIQLWQSNHFRVYRVQIPLWSMNTLLPALISRRWYLFRFLYGRWIRYERWTPFEGCNGSDSSMVDEYPCRIRSNTAISSVQIPLWSMNTQGRQRGKDPYPRFRFLYGRWIPPLHCYWQLMFPCSDSSMVDEYQHWTP